MKNIKIEFTNERIIPASGLAVVGAILGKSDFVKRCNRMDVTPNRSQHQIKNGDILLTYISMLCMGKPEFQAVHEMDDDRDFYKTALGIAYNIPSEETLRQRMDDIGSSLREHILEENVELLRMNGIVPSKLPIPMPIQTTSKNKNTPNRFFLRRFLCIYVLTSQPQNSYVPFFNRHNLSEYTL